MPFDSIYHMCCTLSRMALRFFAEGIFIYLIVNNINNQNVCKKPNTLNKKKMLLFSSFYTSVVLTVDILGLMFAICDVLLFRLTSAILVFFYTYYKQQKMSKNLVSNYNKAQSIWYAVTSAVILALAGHSFNYIGYMLVHKSFVLMGIYDTAHSVDFIYQLYKTAVVFLDAFLMFLVYKFKFINMKDMKNMSMHKRIPISFAFCLISFLYIEFICNKASSPTAGREALLWMAALTLPSYIGFYLTATKLTRLLSFKSNAIVDSHIHVWLSNPSMVETTHLDVYDSKVFIANFELKKLDIKKRLKKLGINDEYRGYSGLILCLFLTRLFMGLKGWNFETDVFWQTSLVIDVDASKLRKDIENIIDQIWNTSEVETLIDGYYLPYHNKKIYNQTQRPTVEQFLTDVAKSI